MLSPLPQFYHLWAGFENGAFIGSYNDGTNVGDRYTMSWQEDTQMSCAYNYTAAAWSGALSVAASGLPAVADPNTATLSSYCREMFVVHKVTGKRQTSIGGAPYDCRQRGWYFATKANRLKQWSAMCVSCALQMRSYNWMRPFCLFSSPLCHSLLLVHLVYPSPPPPPPPQVR